MRRPTDNQRKFACDIASKLSIPLPEYTFDAYNEFIRNNKKAFQERLKIDKIESRRYVIPEVEPRFFVKQIGNLFSQLPLTNTDNLRLFLFPLIRSLTQEVVCVVSLDQYDAPISIAKVAMGSKGSEAVTQSMIFRTAVLQNARSIILVHSHIDSDEDEPTEGEALLYLETADAGQILGIPVKSMILIGSYGTTCYHTKEDLQNPNLTRIEEHRKEAQEIIARLKKRQAAEKETPPAAKKPAPKKAGSKRKQPADPNA